MQFADYMLLKLDFANTEVQQNDNVFKFEAAYTLSNSIRMANDRLDTAGYQRLQQRLVLQQKLIKKYLESKAEIRKNIAYLKLTTFLIPFMTTLKRKNKIPNLNHLLQPYSGKGTFSLERVGFLQIHKPYRGNLVTMMSRGGSCDVTLHCSINNAPVPGWPIRCLKLSILYMLRGKLQLVIKLIVCRWCLRA